MNNGYVYIRQHIYYENDKICKLGKTKNILDKDTTYTTREYIRGYFGLVIIISNNQSIDDTYVEKILQNYFKHYNSKKNGGCEFYDIKNLMFGYTALEILAMGKPLIQTLDYSEDEFKDTFGTTLPPILAAKTEDEIFNQLLFLSNSNNERIKLGKLSKIWFDNNLGVETAKKWFYLIKMALELFYF